jgi:hypothetical protein
VDRRGNAAEFLVPISLHIFAGFSQEWQVVLIRHPGTQAVACRHRGQHVLGSDELKDCSLLAGIVISTVAEISAWPTRRIVS